MSTEHVFVAVIVHFADFWEFWRTKVDGFTAIGKSTPIHVLLAYHCMCKSRDGYYQAKKQLRDHVVSPQTNRRQTERERAWPQHNAETIYVAGDGR